MGKDGSLEQEGSGSRLPGVTGSLPVEGRAARNARHQEVVAIRDVDGIVRARQVVRALAASMEFAGMDVTALAAVTSELARNILQYAGEGVISIAVVGKGKYQGILVSAEDAGPGIANVKRALQPGYSTSGGLGMGLAGVAKIMDQLEIDSRPERGTHIRATLWRSSRGDP